jgi:hypothetical protein
LSWTVQATNQESGFIQAKVPVNPRTFGSLVTIEVRSVSPNTTQVDVASSSSQALDWGKNAANIKDFLDVLDKLVGPRT